MHARRVVREWRGVRERVDENESALDQYSFRVLVAMAAAMAAISGRERAGAARLINALINP